MMYIISSSNKRQEFERLKDALAIKAESDDIYVSDAFGNCTQLSQAQIEEILKTESAQPEPQKVTEQKSEPNQTILTQDLKTQTNDQNPPESTNEVKGAIPNQQPNKVLVYAKYAMIAGIVIVALYMLARFALPALDGLLNIYNKVLG